MTALIPGWSLELLWCLDVAPKAFGVGTFARVAVRQDQPVYVYLPLFQRFCPPGGLFIPHASYNPCKPIRTMFAYVPVHRNVS